MSDDTAFLDIATLSARIEAGVVSPEALVRQSLDRIEGPGRALNAFILVLREAALRDAAAATARAGAGKRLGPLDGLPVAVKDNIDIAGVPTSNGFGGSPWRVPSQDADVVRRLRAAGAVIVGKCNMQEGALGSATDNAHFGRTINPHRAGTTAGGSSGGSAAAVAGGLVVAALGTDTGGSVRIPAAYCGIVGFKPGFGRVSTRGVVPLSVTLDCVGPLTRSVADAILLMRVIAEAPAADGPGDLRGVRFGVLANFDDEPCEPAMAAAFQRMLAALRAQGASVVTLAMPGYDMVRGRRAGFVRVEVDAAFEHGDLYRREPERFSPEMRGYLDYGGRASAVQLAGVERVIAAAGRDLSACLAQVDAILSPTTPQAAFRFGGEVPASAGTFTIPANYAGCPAISIPMGVDHEGMPLGMQLMASQGEEPRLLALAALISYTRIASDRRSNPGLTLCWIA